MRREGERKGGERQTKRGRMWKMRRGICVWKGIWEEWKKRTEEKRETNGTGKGGEMGRKMQGMWRWKRRKWKGGVWKEERKRRREEKVEGSKTEIDEKRKGTQNKGHGGGGATAKKNLKNGLNEKSGWTTHEGGKEETWRWAMTQKRKENRSGRKWKEESERWQQKETWSEREGGREGVADTEIKGRERIKERWRKTGDE